MDPRTHAAVTWLLNCDEPAIRLMTAATSPMNRQMKTPARLAVALLNGPTVLRRFLAVVATPDRFGSCDGTPGTGGAAASREAGAVRAADRAGVQQPGGVPDRRDQPADRETVATRPHDHRQGRPEAALFSCDHAGGRGAGDRGADGPQPVHDQPGAAP